MKTFPVNIFTEEEREVQVEDRMEEEQEVQFEDMMRSLNRQIPELHMYKPKIELLLQLVGQFTRR